MMEKRRKKELLKTPMSGVKKMKFLIFGGLENKNCMKFQFIPFYTWCEAEGKKLCFEEPGNDNFGGPGVKKTSPKMRPPKSNK